MPVARKVWLLIRVSMPNVLWKCCLGDRELATAARWFDRSAFGKEEGFAQAHQALLKALEKAGDFV
jgi:hypothetical protein